MRSLGGQDFFEFRLRHFKRAFSFCFGLQEAVLLGIEKLVLLLQAKFCLVF